MKRSIILSILLICTVLVVIANAGNLNASVIKGIDRQDIQVDDPQFGETYPVVSLTGQGTFVNAIVRIYGSPMPDVQYDVEIEVLVDNRLITSGKYKEIDEGSRFFGLSIFSSSEHAGFIVEFSQPVVYESSFVINATAKGSYQPDSYTGTVIFGN